ncbi:MAG TPA: adenylate/guanylate cyclase domain-containing protein [Acetobacteraceae bacterium]|nr:adenylate/guanylate cyclase domain-containing protein [Acetobacteraceae bacterium]
MSDSAPGESKACTKCGCVGRAGARFCDQCGTALPSVSVPASEAPLASEVKYVTVLFADIVGSTELVADRSPDDARSILEPAVDALVESVEAFGGTLNRVLGDAIMALFGAPLSQEDHALRACCAAQRMHEACAVLDERVQIRVGLASGMTLLSVAGTDMSDTDTYPVFGVTVHLASRLQALARPGTTLCSASVRTLTGSHVDVVPLGPQALRGFSVEQDVFAVHGIRQSGLRFGPMAGRGLSPFVGRDEELAQLARHARTARTISPVAVAIVGDAGLGKSRLAWEFVHSLQKCDWQVIRAEAVSYGRALPYQLIASLLRSVFGIDVHADVDYSASQVYDRVEELGGSSIWMPALLSLLGLPLGEDDAAWEALSSQRRRDAISESVAGLLGAVARDHPTLLLIEDLHWADDESIRILDFSPSSECQMLLLTTQRPEFTHTWRWPLSHSLVLQPLSTDNLDQLIRNAFPRLTDDALRQALIERSSGNPFFLEELARDVSGEKQRENGTNEERLQTPATIQAVISARIDRVILSYRLVLFAASALGIRFDLATLRRLLSDRSDSEFDLCLSTLCQAGMFRRFDEPGSELGFSHALIQEVAYSRLPRAERRDIHARVVQTLRQLEPDRVDDQAETLVYHSVLGEVWDVVMTAAWTAGRRAASRSAYIEATRFFRQGIAACSRLPPSADLLAREIDLRFELRGSLFPTAGIEQSLENSMQAERLARRLGDRRRLAWATGYLSRDLQLVGRPAAALDVAARALKLAGDDRDLTIAARYFSAQASYAAGDFEGTVSTLSPLIADLEAHDPTAWAGTPGPSVVFFRLWLIWALSRLGRAVEAENAASDMRRLADEADHPLSRTLAHLGEGFAFAFSGRLEEAEETLRASLALCRKWDFFPWSTNIMSCLGHVLSRLGQFEEAFDLIDQAVERTRRIGILVSHANELAWLAEAHQLAGRVDLALKHAESAVEVARAHGERGNEALALMLLGEAHARLGSVAAAKANFTRALRLARRLAMVPVIERCRAGVVAIERQASEV